MHSDARTVAAYLRALPPESRAALTRLRALVRAAAPGATESMTHGMPFYELDGPLFAFASQKHYLALYVADHAAVRRHARTVGRASRGKSCVRFRNAPSMDFDGIAALLADAAAARRAGGGAGAKAGCRARDAHRIGRGVRPVGRGVGSARCRSSPTSSRS